MIKRPTNDAPWRRGPTLALAVALLSALLLGAVSCSDDDSGGDEGAAADPAEVADAQPEWLHLGNDIGNSRAAAAETGIGPDNVAELAPSWELADVKGVTGTPIVADGVVYVGDWTGNVRALDAATGEQQWASTVGSYYIGGSVALDDEHVFVGAFDAQVIALDRETGEQKWATKVDEHSQAAIFGSPISVGGMIVVGVASFELMTSNPAPTFRGHVVALDAETGEERWNFWTVDEDEAGVAGVSVWGTVTVDTERGHVYVPTGNSYGPEPSPRSDAVVALDLETGEELWVTQFTVGDVWTVGNQEGTDSDVGAPPNLFEVDGVDALGVPDKAGVYHALDRDTGKVLWTAELTEGGLQGGALASSAVADGAAFVASNRASQDADLVALDLDTGDELWRTDVQGHVSGPVTWANGVIYLANDTGRIVGYSAEDGAVLWAHEVASPAAGGVAVVDGTVYAGWGWWFASPPPEPEGGMIAFRLGGESAAPSEGDDGGDGESAARSELGEEVYRERCSSCHGGDGTGGSGPSLVGVADRLTLGEQVEIVEDGRDAMPGWDGTLSAEEIEAVVEYQRSAFTP